MCRSGGGAAGGMGGGGDGDGGGGDGDGGGGEGLGGGGDGEGGGGDGGGGEGDGGGRNEGEGDGGEGDGGDGGGGGDGGEGIKKIALLEPSASAVRVPLQLSSSMTTEPPSWSYTVWKTMPVPESGMFVAVVVMVPKQMVSRGGKTISLGNLSSPQRLSSGHEKGE